MKLFSVAKQEFDKKYGAADELECFLPEHLTYGKITSLKKKNGTHNEQYYKWQFLYSIVHSGMYAKDYVGTEIQFPKGNKNAANLKLDIAIFNDNNWFVKYEKYHTKNDPEALDWLRKHLIATVEVKKEESKDISSVWDKQLKAYLKESETDFCLGAIYDTEKLYLFKKEHGKFLRYSDEFNLKGQESSTKELSLHLPDPYLNLPNFETINNWDSNKKIDRSLRNISDLDVISGVHSTQINTAMSAILRTMDKQGLVNQRGYEILIQILSLKIFDEKRNESNKNISLEFYLNDDEKLFSSLSNKKLQDFLKRIDGIRDKARGVYYRILKDDAFNIKNENHVKIIMEVVSQFQDYSFVRSTKTDLYQLVFHQFASQFSKDQNAQFVTPLPIIEFLVDIVNPRNGETVIDPTVGIADFLSVAYVNSKSKLDDNNIYGFDIDEDMIKLATLNMLLNGDGNAKIKAKSGNGSIDTKFANNGDLLTLTPITNKKLIQVNQ
jgi:type I restriction enzyme M protein